MSNPIHFFAPKAGSPTTYPYSPSSLPYHPSHLSQAKWLHPTLGTHLATIGSDRLLRLFSYDPSATPLSGRCFSPTAQITSKSSTPFVSLDIHTSNNIYTTLATVDRSGLLTLFVPDSPDNLTSWRVLSQLPTISPPPTAGEETSFKVRFDPNLSSLAYIHSLTSVKDSLRLVVCAMDVIKIYHASSAPSSSTSFQLVASLTLYPGVLIRDVTWAPFNVRGVDLLATASRNGAVTIIEMSHKPSSEGVADQNAERAVGSINEKTGTSFPRHSAPPTSTSIPPTAAPRPIPQSHLSSALASRPPPTLDSSNPNNPNKPGHPPTNPLPYTTHLKIVTSNTAAHADAWSLSWDPAGQVLLSNGSEGRTVMWKKSILQGEWREFSSVEFEEDGEGEE